MSDLTTFGNKFYSIFTAEGHCTVETLFKKYFRNPEEYNIAWQQGGKIRTTFDERSRAGLELLYQCHIDLKVFRRYKNVALIKEARLIYNSIWE